MSCRRFGVLYCFLACLMLPASVPAQRTERAQEAEQSSQVADDRATIEKGIQAYVEAFNKNDVDGVVARWSADGVFIDQATGQRISGREEMKESLRGVFASASESRLHVEIESIDFVSPNVALESGTSTIYRGEGESTRTRYNAVHIKRDGDWLIARITESPILTPPSQFEQLKDLEWMIGQWTDQDDEGTVTTECHWARNKNFLVRSFTASVTGSTEMAGMQLIGWDPAKKTIRSWVFDSDGGFNQAVWNKTADTWAVQQTATLPDGGIASATSLLTPLDENSFAWEQVNRVVDGELLPNLPRIVIRRVSEQ